MESVSMTRATAIAGPNSMVNAHGAAASDIIRRMSPHLTATSTWVVRAMRSPVCGWLMVAHNTSSLSRVGRIHAGGVKRTNAEVTICAASELER